MPNCELVRLFAQRGSLPYRVGQPERIAPTVGNPFPKISECDYNYKDYIGGKGFQESDWKILVETEKKNPF